MDLRAQREGWRRTQRRKARGARLGIGTLMVLLVAPLFRLQVRDSGRFEGIAQHNRLRPFPQAAPRGTIFDRDGHVVAESTIGYRILLMPAKRDTLRARAARLKDVLALSDEDLETAFRRYRRALHLPMELVRDASFDQVSRLEERRPFVPEAIIEEYTKRAYPAGSAIAHFVGYVGEISEKELESEKFDGYAPGQLIGKAGIERQYEEYLGGRPGIRYLEIDARGKIRRWMPDSLNVRPARGKDLHLYLDLDLQEYIAKIFLKEFSGAIVALDPKTGGILAYYSNPSYDPNRFIGGIPIDYWRQLQADSAKPLLDRVAAGSQPAASTWKLAVAGMALDLGVIHPDEVMPIPCTGGMAYQGRYARCWDHSGHGYQNLINGIKNSCNVYFYQVGIRIGLRRFLATGTRLGFARKSNVDLPQEIRPTFPSGLDYWKKHFHYDPQETEVMSLAIGQGPIAMTVLKVAQIHAALSRPDSKMPAPRFAKDFGPPPDTFHIKLSRRDVWYMQAGMRRVTGPGGTAALSRLQNWEFIGKTGTAQNPHGKDHGWFVGTGGKKGGEAEIAVTIILEHAEHGAVASGYAAETVNYYLNKKYGLPQPDSGLATPRFRIAKGLPVNWDYSAPVVDPPMPDADKP